MTFYRLVLNAVIVAASMASFAAPASVPTLADCLEASDFIVNAALSRDNGMTRHRSAERRFRRDSRVSKRAPLVRARRR